MEQIERIRTMERALDDSQQAVKALMEALKRYLAVKPSLQALQEYYCGPLWMRDYDDEMAGNIPGDLKRGVLAEDAVWDLLTEERQLTKLLRQAAELAAGADK